MSNYDIIQIDGIDYIYDLVNDKIIESNDTKTSFDKKDLSDLENNDFHNKKIKSDMVMDELWYPKKPDIDLWESFLNRSLSLKEKAIILDTFVEKDLNNSIKGLQQNILGSNCFIHSLTENNGNCLFESLGKLGLGELDSITPPHIVLRKNLASILLYMRNITDFFPNISLTPEEIFENSNEIEFFKNNNTGDVYVYNYDMMICDLRTNYSWERLPTELILLTVSRLYEVKILIYHNKTRYINEINVWKGIIPDDEIDIIRLGHINEEHYLPVLKLPDELIDDIDTIHNISKIKLEYDYKKINYKAWAEKTANEHYIELLTKQENFNLNSTINKNEQEYVEKTKSSQTTNQNKNKVEDFEFEPGEKLNLDDFEIL